jgi:hypothetical protein
MDMNDKSTTSHVDTIENATPSDGSGREVPIVNPHNANEEIIVHLQNTGEDVGMTFRSIMAAVVCIGNLFSIMVSNYVTVHGHVL